VAGGALVAAAGRLLRHDGGGAAAGIVVALLLFPSDDPWQPRLRRVGLFLGATLVAFVVLGLLLTPYASFPGMLRDVFVYGSEPKGTRAQLLARIGSTAASLVRNLGWLPATIPAVALVVASLWARRRERTDAPAPVWLHVALVWTVGVVAAAAPVLVAKGGAPLVGWLWSRPGGIAFAGQRFWYVLVPAACFLLFVRKIREEWLPPAFVALGMYLAGMLSCPTGWSPEWVDFWGRLWSPPLVFLGNAACLVLVRTVAARTGPRAMIAAQLFVGLEIVCPYWLYTWHPRLVDALYERWDDVPALGPMKVRRDLHAARDAIVTVRMLAADGEVLWLPDDPPVDAYVGRPRPRLSSPLVFMDQYPDRWVDADFDRLRATPPAIIVLGPDPRPPIWPQFRTEPVWGTTRLVQRVENELLPARYEPVAALPWPDPLGERYRVYRRR
jgi:hypothetical protein